MSESTAKQIWTTLFLTLAILTILAFGWFVQTHWIAVTAFFVLAAAWVLGLPGWLWICLSLLLAARIIGKAIERHP